MWRRHAPWVWGGAGKAAKVRAPRAAVLGEKGAAKAGRGGRVAALQKVSSSARTGC